MQLLTLWIVTQPTQESVLADICFATTPAGFVRQVRGGLHEEDNAGCFTEEADAVAMAQTLLAQRAIPMDGLLHTRDVQCLVDPATGVCTDCGVVHGEPCLDCGGRGFHQETCPVMVECVSRTS